MAGSNIGDFLLALSALWIELETENGLYYLSMSRNRVWTTTDLYTVLQIYLYVHSASKGRL